MSSIFAVQLVTSRYLNRTPSIIWRDGLNGIPATFLSKSDAEDYAKIMRGRCPLSAYRVVELSVVEPVAGMSFANLPRLTGKMPESSSRVSPAAAYAFLVGLGGAVGICAVRLLCHWLSVGGSF